MIEAFRHCRPVICVDGTLLTVKYKGQILTAIGTDGNNQIVPLAMAFVEGENYLSWLWFFRQIKIAIVKDQPNVCILHDRHAGILKAIKTLQQPGMMNQRLGRTCRAGGACAILGLIFSLSSGVSNS